MKIIIPDRCIGCAGFIFISGKPSVCDSRCGVILDGGHLLSPCLHCGERRECPVFCEDFLKWRAAMADLNRLHSDAMNVAGSYQGGLE